MKAAAAWLAERLAAEARPVLPARAGAARAAARARGSRRRTRSGSRRRCARSRAEPPAPSLAHLALRFPPVAQFLERFRAVLRRRSRFDFDAGGRRAVARRAGGRVPRAARAAQGRRDRARAGGAVRADPRRAREESPSRRTKGLPHGTPAPPDRRQPGRRGSRGRSRRCSSSRRSRCPSRSSRRPRTTTPSASRRRSALLAERYREGRSGIVLEHVAGGYAFRASREAAEACARLVRAAGAARACRRRRSRRSRSSRTSARARRPEIARIRGVAADSAVAGLVERGLIAEAGREATAAPSATATTPLFERVFGLESLAELPRLDDLGRRRGRAARAARGVADRAR